MSNRRKIKGDDNSKGKLVRMQVQDIWAMLKCRRCGRRYEDAADQEQWSHFFEDSYMTNIATCPTCQTPEDHAELAVNDISDERWGVGLDSSGRFYTHGPDSITDPTGKVIATIGMYEKCAVCGSPTKEAVGSRDGRLEVAAAMLVAMGMPIDDAIRMVKDSGAEDNSPVVIWCCKCCAASINFKTGPMGNVPCYSPRGISE